MEKSCEKATFLKVDGIPNIFRSPSKCVAVCWLILLLASASVCSWLIVAAVQQFYEFKVSTSIRVHSEQASVLPTISICNMNPFTSNFSTRLFAEANISMTFTDALDVYMRYFNQLQAYLLQKRGFYLTDDELAQMSVLDEALLYCEFGGQPCSSRDFEPFFHPVLFNCYKFNGNASKISYAAGLSAKLTVRLYTGVPDELDYTFYRGFMLFIQNASDYPYSMGRSLFRLAPGLGATFVPERSFYNQYPAPYSDCTVLDDNTLTRPIQNHTEFDELVRTGYLYTQNDCFALCKQHIILSRCQCRTSFTGSLAANSSTTYCSSKSQGECIRRVSALFVTIENFLVNECLSHCPLECHQSSLRPLVYYYQYPYDVHNYTRQQAMLVSQLAESVAGQRDARENLATNVVEFNVYYDSLSYMEVVEEPKLTWDSLIGIVGGHLHLFLGMSLLSVVEVFEWAAFVAVSALKFLTRSNYAQ